MSVTHLYGADDSWHDLIQEVWEEECRETGYTSLDQCQFVAGLAFKLPEDSTVGQAVDTLSKNRVYTGTLIFAATKALYHFDTEMRLKVLRALIGINPVWAAKVYVQHAELTSEEIHCLKPTADRWAPVHHRNSETKDVIRLADSWRKPAVS